VFAFLLGFPSPFLLFVPFFFLSGWERFDSFLIEISDFILFIYFLSFAVFCLNLNFSDWVGAVAERWRAVNGGGGGKRVRAV
jgi:hypothetical protein